MSKEQIVAQLRAVAARELEVRAMLICSAEDPVMMVEVLRPRLVNARGEIIPLWYTLAQVEMQNRATHLGTHVH